MIFLKSFIEFATYLIIGQWLTYIICFGKHHNNVVYKIFLLLTSPFYKLVDFITFKKIKKELLPISTLVILLFFWVILLFFKAILMNQQT
ncbi:MAG: hypothetical protein CBD16_07810 [Betaproteobacteria bacterium TMED156]|nr:MAG: hypothetical protein CBD16_07810 [Betaproteobacteria bacterium TMED156]